MKKIFKTGIIYAAVDDQDADEFLEKIQEIIKDEIDAKINFRLKTLETPDCFIEARSVTNADMMRIRRARYIVLSERKTEMSIKDFHNIYHWFIQIKANLIFDAKEIDMERLMNILRNASKGYCATCKWYSTYLGICCNGISDFRTDLRCLDDSCELWEKECR